ncbi:hybrid sensor histidine kinase/response regulator [Pleurocapsa sp. FMAR1]|uniref:hybrid sensor histidine kinase/response regulator n=1 Tax=Pleurocapsa sp. FMAR1 TaxID=3040204 RepID=UPI0029C7F50D|nr:response regulator [Pleurocapsa sp. FMAR1]
MSSQDKSLETNDNLNEPSKASEGSADLWTEDDDSEIVTEFISAETLDSEESSTAETDQTKKKVLSDADFDNWDFRDPLLAEDGNTLESNLVLDNSPEQIKSSPEVDELITNDSQQIDLVEADLQENIAKETDLNSSADIEFDDLESLTEALLNLEDSEDIQLDDLSEFESLTAKYAQENNLEEIDLNILDKLDDSALDLDSAKDLQLDSLELNDFEGLSDLNSLTAEGLDNDLDGILDLETEIESLDSLVLESTSETIENSLDSDLELSSLDSLLGDEVDSLLEVVPAAFERPKVSPAPVTVKVSNEVADLSPVNQAQSFDQTMRVSVKKLDDLNNLIGELVVKRNRLEDDQERLRRFLDNLLGHVQSLGDAGAKMHDMYERSLLEGALIASRQSRANSAVAAGGSGFGSTREAQAEGLDALEMDRFNGFHLVSQDIIELIVRVREAASDIQFVVDETDKVAQTFRQVTGQLQDGMNSSRMVAFEQTTDRLPRAIRDISRKQKKQTQLYVEGKDVLIDKMIVEHLYNPMTHLVNNAISHGIEKPEERLKKGKPEVGNINIRAFIQGNQTVITVRDDGAGIDLEIVKQKAVEKNLITWATAQNLTEQQVYELLFHPGFSTKDQADDFAGRGVGMDVVNTDLKKIRGSVSTESEVGKGTTFTIRLPLVLSICKALTCVDDNTKIAFPIDGVEDTKEYLPSDITTNANGLRCITWKNTLLPLRPLKTLLNYNRKIRRAGIYNANQNNDDTISVIILRSLDNLLAVEVDEVKAEQEIVIKQIDGAIPKPPGIAGATVLGDGTIMPIGDVLELIEIAQGKRTIEIGFDVLAGEAARKQFQAESIQQEPMVLVVDDSITVRELLSMSFNKLGYRVEQARDGQEAWDKLRGGLVCDMIFSDIEMPRMNGLELLSNLHKDQSLRSIPVAMLTSRGADKHRQIANDLGAKAYLTKPYTEKDLMDVAQHLIDINRANKEAESVTVNFNRVKNNLAEAEFENAPLVLIIDDSVTVRELLSMTFKKAGYRVEQARDGQEAWEKLSDGLECDIAFCDIEMPRMNGLELLSQLQQDEKLSSLPIAMLTSRGAKKMRNIAASRGANGYFVKPYVEDDLLKAAKRMMDGETLIKNEDEG